MNCNQSINKNFYRYKRLFGFEDRKYPVNTGPFLTQLKQYFNHEFDVWIAEFDEEDVEPWIPMNR